MAQLGVLSAAAARLGIGLAEDQRGRMSRYVALLGSANARLNLTRIVEPADVERRHLLDALTCALADLGRFRMDGARCIDVGSGGGVPGIPLAVAFPGLHVTLLEATGKKAEFLREAVTELGLTNVEVCQERAEVAGRSAAHRDAHDLVVARALAPLPVALEWCLPFARPGGLVILPRGSDLAAQLADGRAAATALAGSLREPVALEVPELPPGRSLVVAEKLGPTPERFPRRAGVAAKRPLSAQAGLSTREREAGL